MNGLKTDQPDFNDVYDLFLIDHFFVIVLVMHVHFTHQIDIIFFPI